MPTPLTRRCTKSVSAPSTAATQPRPSPPASSQASSGATSSGRARHGPTCGRRRARSACAGGSEVPAGGVSSSEPMVRAGGGVLRRRPDNGHYEYAVVHRPKYGDWSLPKGKVDPGESDEQAALREVEEET